MDHPPDATSLLHHFAALKDPRQRAKVVYPLPEILLLVLCATIVGAEDFVEITHWGAAHMDFLRRFLPYKDGIPSHDALNDLINALHPKLFSECFIAWVSGLRVSGAAAPRCAARGKSGQMSSVTDEDGMAKRASETGSARTTDRYERSRSGHRRRRLQQAPSLDGQQKRQIVAESMAPGMSAAMVAGRHGISTGQFYAWRQQLLLRGAFGAEADSVPNLAGIDATASTPQLKLAIPAPPEPGTPTTAAAPVPLVQPDDRIDVTLSDGVATERLVEDFAFGTLLRPIVGAYSTVPLPHPWIAVRPTIW